MREIKFKAYVKRLNWTVPVERINFDVKTIEVDLTDGNGDLAEYNFNEVVLMQYTGLKDKSGVEVYEGYIFNLGDKNITYEVVWYYGGFMGKQISGSSYVGLKNWEKQIEVIGNIYENLELIKGE